MVATQTRVDLAGLTTRIVGPADAKLTCLLMHGFGAGGDDLVPLAQALSQAIDGRGTSPAGSAAEWQRGSIDAPVRFVFPEAPLELGGMYGDARAWWLLDLARLEHDMASGVTSDRRNELPDGLVDARAHVSRLIDQLQARYQVAPDQLVIGGFSQGAMLALDVALHREAPPAGLVLMSGTLIAESEWAPRMAQLAGVPVMMSHGRHDGLLPYRIAEVLRDQLTAAGAVVDWQPFLGGHEIPTAVIGAVGALLRNAAA